MSDVLAERYGTGRPVHRRILVAGVTVLALAAIAWLVWATAFHSNPAVQSELVAYEVVDEHQATARVMVDRDDPDVVASCLLRATARDHSIVGELNFTVDSGEATGTTSRTIRTERRATSVSLVGCVTEGQEQPR